MAKQTPGLRRVGTGVLPEDEWLETAGAHTLLVVLPLLMVGKLHPSVQPLPLNWPLGQSHNQNFKPTREKGKRQVSPSLCIPSLFYLEIY